MAENIYTKLSKMRVQLQRMNIKKSGFNKYSGYAYYELADILPPINDLQEDFKTCSFVTFDKEMATLTLLNSENPDEVIRFTSPMAELELKAANPIQNLGGIETYQRRYLYMAAFEIVENDYFDATQGKNEDKANDKAKPQASKKNTSPAISEATANDLNLRIKTYALKSGLEIKTIVSDIAKVMKKDMKEINESDAKKVMLLLEKWSNDLEVM